MQAQKVCGFREGLGAGQAQCAGLTREGLGLSQP